MIDARAGQIDAGNARVGKRRPPHLDELLHARPCRRLTGALARTGFVGNMVINIPTPGGNYTIDGSSYYHPDYWEPAKYVAAAMQVAY